MLHDLDRLTSVPLRRILERLGSASPLVLGAAYLLCMLVVIAVAAAIPDNRPALAFVQVLFTIVFSLLFVTVTWFRHDDWLSAGVLVALIVFVPVAVLGLIAVFFDGGIGPASIWTVMNTWIAIIYAIVFAPIAGGCIALARRLTRGGAH